MKQFLMLLGVAAVAGAMYVAGAAGSQQAKFASQKEVVALQKKVTSLTNEIKKTVKPEADISAAYILTCLASVDNSGNITINALGASQRGDISSGYLFGDSTSSTPTTALDVDNSSTPGFILQEFDPACLTGAALHHAAARAGIGHFAGWAAKNTR